MQETMMMDGQKVRDGHEKDNGGCEIRRKKTFN